MLGPRQHDTQVIEESCPDWQFQQNLKRLARSLSTSGVPVTPDSDGEEIALGSAEENAKRHRAAWKQARECLRVAKERVADLATDGRSAKTVRSASEANDGARVRSDEKQTEEWFC